MASKTATFAEDDGITRDKLSLMERDRKAFFENSQEQLRRNKTLIGTLRREQKELKASLSTLAKEGSTSPAYQQSELDKIANRINLLRRRQDELKFQTEQKRASVTRLKQTLKDLERESQPVLLDDSPLARKIRMLENRLDKSMIKYNEALSIRRTYEQIVKRLKEERIGFDNQLVAIERTLKAKDHDFQELLNMSHDANHAKELQKQELAQFRAAYEEERRQKDRDLSERKQFVQSRIDQTQRLEKKEKLRRQAEIEAQQREEEEARLAVAAAATKADPGSDVKNEDEAALLAEYEEVFRKIKEATGVSDVPEVIQKFITQEETHRNLIAMVREAQTRIEAINSERAELKAKVEELRYSGSGQLGSRRIVDEFETHLAEAQHQCDKQRGAYERVARILIHVKAGIEHLHDKLSVFKTDMPAIAMNDDSVVDVLKQCEAKLMLLLEETAGVADKGDQHMDGLAAAAAGHVVLPANNQRIRIPTGDEDDQELEDEDEPEDEDVLDRTTIKKMAGLAIQRETRKLKKKRAGRRGKDTKDSSFA